MVLWTPGTRGDLALGTLSELLLTLTRFVATGVDDPSVHPPLDGLADLELPLLELSSDMALYPVETELRRDWRREYSRVNDSGTTST